MLDDRWHTLYPDGDPSTFTVLDCAPYPFKRKPSRLDERLRRAMVR